MWIVEEDREADIASDLSAFHRVDDVAMIDGPRYFSLANRLSAYNGVIGAVVAQRQMNEERGHDGSSTPAHSRIDKAPEAAALAAAGDWIEHVKSEG